MIYDVHIEVTFLQLTSSCTTESNSWFRRWSAPNRAAKTREMIRNLVNLAHARNTALWHIVVTRTSGPLGLETKEQMRNYNTTTVTWIFQKTHQIHKIASTLVDSYLRLTGREYGMRLSLLSLSSCLGGCGFLGRGASGTLKSIPLRKYQIFLWSRTEKENTYKFT